MYQINKILFDCNNALYIQLKEKFLNEKSIAEEYDIPFLEKNYGEVILEDTTAFASRFGNLKEYLLSAGMSSFFCMKFFNPKDDNENCCEGFLFEIPSAYSKAEFNKFIPDEMIDINGVSNYYFDKSFTWCVIKKTDLLYVTGPEKFINTFFTSYKEKIEEVKTFIRSYEDGFSLDCPKKAKDALRVVIDGHMVARYEEIKSKLYPKWPDLSE